MTPRGVRKKVARTERALKNGTSFDDMIDREPTKDLYVPEDFARDPRVIRSDELIRRVRSLRAHAGYVVRECNELLADLGADDVANAMRRAIGSGTFDGDERAIAQRVDAGEHAAPFDEPDPPQRSNKRGKK